MGTNKEYNRAMEKQKYNIRVMDFSTSPGPRYTNQGEDSGESYYHDVLNEEFNKAINNNMILVVDLDGPDGYASSFLDEAFGNLIYDFGVAFVKDHLEIKSNEEPEWIEMLTADTFEKWETRRNNNQQPIVTTSHKAWDRLHDGKIEKRQWISYSGK